jgi:tetratricopeptide (TPR) repeat protein
MVRVGALLLVCAIALPARAGVPNPKADPDTEAAQRHFLRGSELYADGSYPEAIVEFEKARGLARLPALDYNIARCHDRLEHWREAVEAYRRYLEAAPKALDAAEVRARIELLQKRVPDQPPSPPPPPPVAPRRNGILYGGVALIAVGVALAAASLWSSIAARGNNDDLVMACGPTRDRCPIGFDATRDTGQHEELAAWVLGGVAAAAVVTGAALTGIGAQRRTEKLSIAPVLLPGGGALTVGGRF